MNIEENLVETPENVEEPATEETVETVEEPEKLYTKAELEVEVNKRLDGIMPKKIERIKAKTRREFEEKYAAYKETEEVLKVGLGTENIAEANEQLREFYKQKGYDIPRYEPETVYSDEDQRVLANNEAQKIIEAGLDEVIEEVNRLADKGVEGMNAREKHLFTQLAEYRKLEESRVELAKIGVKAEALNDEGFKEFEKKLNPSMPIREKYEMYLQSKPKANIEPIGSMKGTKSKESAVKDFYTYEEAMKFTKEDFDKNPALFKAVENSMPNWK